MIINFVKQNFFCKYVNKKHSSGAMLKCYWASSGFLAADADNYNFKFEKGYNNNDNSKKINCKWA